MLGKKKKENANRFWTGGLLVCLSSQRGLSNWCVSAKCAPRTFFGGFLCTTRYLPKEGTILLQRNCFFLTQALPPNPGIVRFLLKWYLTGWCLSVVNYCRPKGVFRNLITFPLDLSPSITYSLMIFSIIHYNHFFRITSPEWLWVFGKASQSIRAFFIDSVCIRNPKLHVAFINKSVWKLTVTASTSGLVGFSLSSRCVC